MGSCPDRFLYGKAEKRYRFIGRVAGSPTCESKVKVEPDHVVSRFLIRVGIQGMNSQTKIAILEWVEGILGVVWKIAGVLSLYLLLAVLGFDGSGLSLFIAVNVFSISKVAHNIFRGLKTRVIFESDMMKRGMTQKEATEAWLLKEYTRNTDKN